MVDSNNEAGGGSVPSETVTHKGLNRKILGKLVVVAAMMFGFGYALVPLYRQICEVTGINVLSAQEDAVSGSEGKTNTQVDPSRTITIEFDANSRGPWRFKPAVNSVQVHPGQMTTVVYDVVNTQPRTVNAQAIPSYAPQQAAAHFHKVECFCFRQQTLKPNEAREMPVVFYVDRDLPKDVKTITLSYTFFEVGNNVQPVSPPGTSGQS